MNIEQKKLKLTDLEPNTGQVPGLPSNPRQWTKSDVERIAASLKETPELFEARPIIAVPHGGKYVILGGNLRYEGARHNKEKEVPVAVVPEDTPIDKMKEIVVKDNGSFGAWDYDTLANEWGDLPLGEWGVPVWEPEAVDESALDALFEEAGSAAPKPEIITIEVPVDLADNLEDIRAALVVTLDEWKGCKVK